jgi:ABC-type transporter Mla MlaB component
VGLFSLFKRNHPGQDRKTDTAEANVATDAPRRERDADAARLLANTETERQREIARATAMKIDAIEAAMANDIFNTPEPAWGSPKRIRPAAGGSGAWTLSGAHSTYQTEEAATLAQLDGPDTELLRDKEEPEAASSHASPVVEESAILYANGQSEIAAHMLTESLPDTGQERSIWWMLFDLYMVTGQQEQFDNLAIDYASKFETSPPSWNAVASAPQAGHTHVGVTPTVAFNGVLDDKIGTQVARLQQLASVNPVLRLEFSRVTAVEAAGCALLLDCLKRLQGEQSELIVVAAVELANLVKGTLQVGDRGDSEAPWLLLLELLQLLNREKEFEEAAMDYCVTYEVSPPSFAASKQVATADRQYASAAPDRFMLPAEIEGNPKALLDGITAYAEQYEAVVFDCSRLLRIEFGAAGILQGHLATLAQAGKKIEFRDVNHLVAALLRLLAYSDIAKIFPHKY